MKGYFKLLLMVLTLILAALVTTNWTSQSTYAAGPWYVTPDGDDANPCNSPAAPCRSIDAVLAKDGFVAGDTIFVASGTYTGSGGRVVTLEKSTSLSGGWNHSFTAQDGFSVIDGEFARGGMTVGDVSVRVERFVFRNGYAASGGGIYSDGDLTLDHCTIAHNTGAWNGGGVAVTNDRKLVIRFSAVYSNSAIQDGGGIYITGPLVVDNTTVSGNTAGGSGGGLHVSYTSSSATLNSATFSGNAAASGGGPFIHGFVQDVAVRNTILAGNTAATGPDCQVKLVSAGYNLIGNTAGCDYTAGPGDLTGVDPHLGRLVGPEGHPRYHPLLSGSPAIDAGDPAGCFGSEGLLSTDQRGAARVGRCDIGAYEYTPPGPAATIYAHSGTPQRTSPLLAFGMPLQAAVLDGIGSPVNNAMVAFSAPASGPSGTFADTGTYTTTATTSEGGVATAATFTANELLGTYTVTATVGGVATQANFLLRNSLVYVAPGGDGSNDCQSPTTPCATINGAMAKASPGDTIYVAAGTYTGTGEEVALLNKNVTLSGGWNDTFIMQSGISIIDGQGSRRGITVDSGITATIERFTVQKGVGVGIYNQGSLTMNNSTVSDNSGGISNVGVLTLNNSTVSDNTDGGFYWNGGTLTLNNSTVSGNAGGGISNGGTLTLNNCTLSGNKSRTSWGGRIAGGAIYNSNGTLTLNSSTVAGNVSDSGGGIYIASGTATLQNSIVAGNTAASGPDCSGSIGSAGYNLIGNTSGCGFTPGTGDQTDVNPDLGPLLGPPGMPKYHYLALGSPAIDAGNPAGCTGSTGPLTTDQRGAARVGRCDIGAYEYTTPGPAASIHAFGGTPQHAPPSGAYMIPLQALVLDSIGSPVINVTVMFSAPVSGASGMFADTGAYTTTATTAETSIATAATFTANEVLGSYVVTATVSGVATPAHFLLHNILWYVAPGGDDSNDCLSPTSACATINRALSKPSFFPGDTARVASGTYTGISEEVVLFNKDATLSGGWDAGFTTQSGMCTIDGERSRRGITISGGVIATIEHFTVQNCSAEIGGGIFNTTGSLTLNDSTVRGNTSQYSAGGIYNQEGTLTLNNSTVTGNSAQSYGYGGGILHGYGDLTLNNSTVSDNTAGGPGGGISNDCGTVTLNNSSVDGNEAGRGGGGIQTYRGIVTLNSSAVTGNATVGGTWAIEYNGGGIHNDGILILNNSTVSGNTASGQGGGILVVGCSSVMISNSTVSNNKANLGGGIYGGGGSATLQNTIVAGNTALASGPDCWGDISSAGYNLIGTTSDCGFTSGPGDLTEVNARLGRLIAATGVARYHPLLPGSPAIDAGNPAGCTDHLGDPLDSDQRGASHVGRCDIGAYEYTIPGPAASISAIGGTPQHAPPFFDFWMPLEAAVLDTIGSPVSNATVAFSAPVSGPSGTFADTGTFTTTAVTDESGVATAATFTPNGLEGSYVVTATASGVVSPTTFLLSNFGWYVAPGGNDASDCLSPATPCATINGALGKTGFLAGDTVFIAAGTYTGTEGDAEVVALRKSVRLLGGWDTTFTTQSGTSIIDGQGSRRGITVSVTARIERFTVTSSGGGIYNNGTLSLNNCIVNGNSAQEGGGIYNSGTLKMANVTLSGNEGRALHNTGLAVLDHVTVRSNRGAWAGAGLYNSGSLTLNNSAVSENSGTDIGGGIWNSGDLTLNNSTVSGHAVYNLGGGIFSSSGMVVLNNSTVSGNTTNPGASPNGRGGGIYVSSGTLSLNSSTISGNRADQGGGVGVSSDTVVTMQNTILAGNSGSDCSGTIGSAGYNLIGNISGCTFSASTGDLLNVNPRLFPFLVGSPGYYPLLRGSPAIDAGNPAGCTDNLGNPLTTDQRGVPRVGRCDIGSYEFDPSTFTYVFLPILFHYCPPLYADDFSNPASGWEVGEDEYVHSEYLNGEYRVRTKRSGYVYLFRAPTCDRQNYMVEADARWVGTPGASYGLIFGITGDFNQFYLFDVNTDHQQYWLLRCDPSGCATLVDPTDSPAIHSGTASNHLKVTRNGSQITLEVNGTVLGTWQDSIISGLTGAGLASSPYEDAPVSDARFDNFRVTSLTSSMMQQSSINPSTEVEGSQVIPQGFPKVVTFNNQ